MKKETINLRIDEDTKKELEKIADKEERTLSNLVIKILKDFLKKEK